MSTPGVEAPRPARPPRERLASVKDKSLRGRRQQRRKPAKIVQCPECQSTEIFEHDGHTVCGDCGISINESNIVSEVTFGESNSGAAVVQGAFVGQDQRHARGNGAWGRLGRAFNVREPRELSEAHGKDELRKQGSWHHLPDHIVDRAFSIYKLALTSGFNQGRPLSMVAAACLYAACRRDKESQMLLIDFAEGIAVNVFRIGQTWQELKKRLFLEDTHYRPVMEVEDLVARFMKKLEFGRDMKKVANDALLILRRMKRDWMVTGRRPNGLIGACIILAARMNNYRRTVREVVYVVKVADMTVAKRLEEFKRTPSAAMTVDEFKEKGMRLKQGIPPAIYEREAREKKKRSLQQMLESSNTVDDQSDAQSAIESVDEPPTKSPRREVSLLDRPLRRDADGFPIPHIPGNQNHTSSPAPSANPSESLEPDSTHSTPDRAIDDFAGNTPTPGKKQRGRTKTSKSKAPILLPAYKPEDLLSEQELEREMEIILSDTRTFLTADEDIVTADAETEERAKRLASALRRGIEGVTSLLVPQVSDDPEVKEAEFEDDPEVAHCLLSEEEQKIKERIWVTHNEDWLRSQQAKMLKKALDEAHGTNQKKKERKKRKKSRMGDGSLLEDTPAETAADAARLMLEKHATNPSRHINYANVDKLYAVFGEPASSEGTSTRAGSAVPSENAAAARKETSAAPVAAGLPTPAATQDQMSATEDTLPGNQALHDEEQPEDTEVDAEPPVLAWDSEQEDDEDDDDDEYVAQTIDAVGAGYDSGGGYGSGEEDEDAGFSETEDD